MRLYFVLLFIYFFSQSVIAQNNQSYEEFRANIMSGYHSFRNGVLENYADFLDGIWRNYELFKSDRPDLVPKPDDVPKVDDDPTLPKPINIPIELDSIDTPLKPKQPSLDNISDEPTIDKVIPSEVPQTPDIPKIDNSIQVKFYGLSIGLPSKRTMFKNGALQRNQIAKYWRALEKDGWQQIVPILLEYKRQYNYSDFMYYLLVSNYACEIESDITKRCVIKLFLLVHSGYDARIAYHNDTLVLLLPFANQLYACTYIVQNGIKYYLFHENNLTSNGSIYSYDLPTKQNNLKLFYANLLDNPHVAVAHKEFYISDGRLTIFGDVNKNLIDLLEDLPQMTNVLYAYPILDNDCRTQIVTSLQKQLEGMSKVEALQALLHFMHYAFTYATDQVQFGKEKPFFFEELLYYPKCDCEDRSVFFAYLVKQVLGLDCHLVDYPGHIAVAVSIEGVTGTYYNYNGRKFYITDPTYIGASIGECMPDYVNTKPKLLILK